MSVVRGLLCLAFLAGSARARAAEPSPPAVAPPSVAPPVRVFMRTAGQPLLFSVRARTASAAPLWCAAPCNQQLSPGEYELKLNGVLADRALSLRTTGTLSGHYQSHAAARSGAWLAVNVGGIIGGVFLTVAALGGPSWAYAAGGGSLAAGGVIYLVSYRADRAQVTFTPGEPEDVRGMPPEAAPLGVASLDRASLGSAARGLGFRISF